MKADGITFVDLKLVKNIKKVNSKTKEVTLKFFSEIIGNGEDERGRTGLLIN